MQLTAPKVSVVMPVYNQQRYVSAAVQSILKQTYADFELVVIDDGSTDQTLEVLKQIQDSRLRIVRASHSGFIKTIVRGINEAQGEWIARMDSDDISHPERLARQMEFLNNHSECVYVAAAYGIVTPNDKYLTPPASAKWHYLTRRDITLATYLFADPSVVFHRAKALAAGCYDDEFENEKPLWYKLLNYGKAAIFEDPLIFVRWRLGSVSRGAEQVKHQASMNRDVRLKYDPENVLPLAEKFSVDTNRVMLNRVSSAVDIYAAAGDGSAARDVAFRNWIRNPFVYVTAKMVLRSLGVKRPMSIQGVNGTRFTPSSDPWKIDAAKQA